MQGSLTVQDGGNEQSSSTRPSTRIRPPRFPQLLRVLAALTFHHDGLYFEQQATTNPSSCKLLFKFSLLHLLAHVCAHLYHAWCSSLSFCHVSLSHHGAHALMACRPVKLLKSETLIITTGTETKTPRVYILMPKWVQEARASCRHQQNEHYLTPKQEVSLK